MGYKKRWRDFLGAAPDDAIAYLHEQATGEPLKTQTVKVARIRAGIPPYTEPYRSQWFERHGVEWEPPPDSDLEW